MAKTFQADYGNTKPQAGGGFFLFPAGTKVLMRVKKAVPGMSSNDNPYVTVDWQAVGGEYDGKEVRYQNVTFLPKTHKFAGIALHTLKCLLQEHQGSFTVNPEAWVGKYAYVTLGVEAGPKGDRNKVMRLDAVPREELLSLGVDESDIPDWYEAEAGEDKPEPAKAKAAPKGAREPMGPHPDAECEVCERKFKDHAKVKHEFSEKVPF